MKAVKSKKINVMGQKWSSAKKKQLDEHFSANYSKFSHFKDLILISFLWFI